MCQYQQDQELLAESCYIQPPYYLHPFLWNVIILKYRVFQKMSLHKNVLFMLYFRVSLFLNNLIDNKKMNKKFPSLDLNLYVISTLSIF